MPGKTLSGTPRFQDSWLSGMSTLHGAGLKATVLYMLNGFEEYLFEALWQSHGLGLLTWYLCCGPFYSDPEKLLNVSCNNIETVVTEQNRSIFVPASRQESVALMLRV